LLYNTEAIVIRTLPYGETSAIVTLLTPSGTVAAMAKGAKKPQSRLAAGVIQCAEGLYTIYQRSGMGTISQVEITATRRIIHERLDLAAHAAYFCELIMNAADERPHGSPAVYRLLRGALDRLVSAGETPDVTARVFETKVLDMFGVSPDWLRCVVCGKELTSTCAYSTVDGGLVCGDCALQRQHTVLSPNHREHNILLEVPGPVSKILHSFRRVPWERLGEVRLNPQTKDVLRRILRVQLTQFAGISVKSLKFLDELQL
jgi:DNA repair protein RecO (recombination protein O)